MKNIRELLQDADPLVHEPLVSSDEHRVRRQAIFAAISAAMLTSASSVGARSDVVSRRRIALVVAAGLIAMVALFLGARMGSPILSDVQAAVRFEVRLAEDKPAPGLREAKVSGSQRHVYLHDEVIVSNGDISAAQIIQGTDPSQYSVSVEFNSSGTEKMRAATGDHIGKLMAILLDGQVVMAPVIRSPIDSSALITGHFTKAQAEKIVNGIRAQ